METQKINTAVVILNWNGIDWLKKFLPIIIDKSNIANIYLADNASDDSSVEFVKNTFPAVNIIQNLYNVGFAKGYNQALSKLTEKYFVLINSDIEVTNNWIEPIINLMEDDDLISACQPKILDYNYFSKNRSPSEAIFSKKIKLRGWKYSLKEYLFKYFIKS